MTRWTAFLFSTALLLFGEQSNGQTVQSDSIRNKKLHRSDLSRCGHNFIITSAYNRTNFNSFELSFGRSYSADWNAFLLETFSQYQVGCEALIDNGKIIYAPKLSAELSAFKILCISRLNLLYYLNSSGQGSLKYRHEIGLTYRGYINLNYCYTFNLTNKSYYDLGHGLNIQLNIPIGHRKFDRIN